MANPLAMNAFNSAYHLVSVQAEGSQRPAHVYNPMADDGVNHFNAGLQPLEFLPCCAFLLPVRCGAAAGTEKELLSMTQRRRE